MTKDREFTTLAELSRVIRYNNNILAVFNRKVDIVAFVDIRIELCVDTWFGDYCVTVFKFKRTWPLWSFSWISDIPPTITDGFGDVLLSTLTAGTSARQSSLPTVQIQHDNAGNRVVTQVGEPLEFIAPNTRGTADRSVLNFKGSSGPFVVSFMGIHARVPSVPQHAEIEMQSEYYGRAEHSLTPTSIWPDINTPLGCARIQYTQLPHTANVTVAGGLPCPTWIEATDSNEVTVRGQRAGFRNKALTVTGALKTLLFEPDEQVLMVTASTLTAGPSDDIRVNYPVGT